jgi:hypothetical protein
MGDQVDAWVLNVEPIGNLTVRDEVNPSHPGGVLQNRPQRISHLLIIYSTVPELSQCKRANGWHAVFHVPWKRFAFSSSL